MAILYVRNFPDDLHRKIKDRASAKHTSMAEELAGLAEIALRSEESASLRLEALNRIAQRRRRYKLPPGAQDAVSMIREDRER